VSDLLKAALIISGAAIIATSIWVYFSPYQTCVRAEHVRGNEMAERTCAAFLSGYNRGK
jgi:hypothetical protein